ncbi:ubiquitin-like-conjugating enzyme ATG10 [Ananas comosus]|uniref:Ubiquitin-like-conjugating enzyme ATG10 n=1 Tax=Ananas comosus TaxID=4615 RepID=A0A6P5GQ47_ANACO|nr:ubiquitin-like-conjugating enzyme ATG10 [Ananas comosus]XP_020107551.1 ubiquitin-like-conjugating enzyme ATG10 [Ananas comosus]
MGSSCLWNGTLSPDEFNTAATALAKRWKETDSTLPEWIWIPCQRMGVSSSNVEGYLALEKVYRHRGSEEDKADDNCSVDEELVDDDATLVCGNNDDLHAYDFHIVYSYSYRVPILYFRGYRSDGHPLSLDEIVMDLPPHSSNTLKESKWTFLTQEEHPYLNRPWYMLHPCGISDWMKLLLVDGVSNEGSKTPQYLPAWLSVIGQAVGLRIPLELHQKP